jgi:hypothetical protein
MNNVATFDKKIDIHIHVVGTGVSGGGCVVSRELVSGSSHAVMIDSHTVFGIG